MLCVIFLLVVEIFRKIQKTKVIKLVHILTTSEVIISTTSRDNNIFNKSFLIENFISNNFYVMCNFFVSRRNFEKNLKNQSDQIYLNLKIEKKTIKT